MEQIQVIIGGKEFTFRVEIPHSMDHGAPWEEEDGHGPVSDWTTRDKQPGELVLNSDRHSKRYYDFAEACRIALRDGWGIGQDRLADWTERAGRAPTKRQIAAAAARADYERLRAWCNDEWRYVGVIVTLLDDDGAPTEVSDSLWGIADDDPEYIRECARNIADELAGGYGVVWGEQQRQTFGYLTGGN